MPFRPQKPVRKVYKTPWSKLAKIKPTPEVFEAMGQCLIDTIIEEAKKDFAKRGWNGKDPKGGPPLWNSFKYKVIGNTLQITSSYYGMKELTSGDIPRRRMTWLTQEYKQRHPEKFKRTPAERRMVQKRGPKGQFSKKKRLPLVVPLKSRSGEVVLRMAPLKMEHAWVHPGIAKFTFMERGIRKGRERCLQILKDFAVDAVRHGDPSR